MLSWIVWNRTVLNLIVCKQKTALILNGIVLNRTVFTFNCVSVKKTALMLNWIVLNRTIFDI